MADLRTEMASEMSQCVAFEGPTSTGGVGLFRDMDKDSHARNVDLLERLIAKKEEELIKAVSVPTGSPVSDLISSRPPPEHRPL